MQRPSPTASRPHGLATGVRASAPQRPQQLPPGVPTTASTSWPARVVAAVTTDDLRGDPAKLPAAVRELVERQELGAGAPELRAVFASALYCRLLATMALEMLLAGQVQGFTTITTLVLRHTNSVTKIMAGAPTGNAAYALHLEIADLMARAAGSKDGAHGSHVRLFPPREPGAGAQDDTLDDASTPHLDGTSHVGRQLVRGACTFACEPLHVQAACGLIYFGLQGARAPDGKILRPDTCFALLLLLGDVYRLGWVQELKRCLGAAAYHLAAVPGVVMLPDHLPPSTQIMRWTDVTDNRDFKFIMPSPEVDRALAEAIMAKLQEADARGDLVDAWPDNLIASFITAGHADDDAGDASTRERLKLMGSALPYPKGVAVVRVNNVKQLWDSVAKKFITAEECLQRAKQQQEEARRKGSSLGGLARGGPGALGAEGVAAAQACATDGPGKDTYKEAAGGDPLRAAQMAGYNSSKRAKARARGEQVEHKRGRTFAFPELSFEGPDGADLNLFQHAVAKHRNPDGSVDTGAAWDFAYATLLETPDSAWSNADDLALFKKLAELPIPVKGKGKGEKDQRKYIKPGKTMYDRLSSAAGTKNRGMKKLQAAKQAELAAAAAAAAAAGGGGSSLPGKRKPAAAAGGKRKPAAAAGGGSLSGGVRKPGSKK